MSKFSLFPHDVRVRRNRLMVYIGTVFERNADAARSLALRRYVQAVALDYEGEDKFIQPGEKFECVRVGP